MLEMGSQEGGYFEMLRVLDINLEDSVVHDVMDVLSRHQGSYSEICVSLS